MISTKSTETTDQTEWFRSVVQQYEGPLTRYAARITGDPERARDVVQETFLRLHTDDASRFNGHLAEWLYTVCRNCSLDVQRKEKRMRPLSESRALDDKSPAPGPASAAEQKETVSNVLELLAELPDTQQEVIRLKFQEGLSYREISGVTGHSVSNVGYLIHTGLKTVRQQVKSNSKAPIGGSRT